MLRTDNLSRQHKEILEVAGSIKGKLPQAGSEAREISKLLGNLGGKIKAHLAMEDEVLYPELLKHENAQVREIADQFMVEMGGIRDIFVKYIQKWCAYTAIEANPIEFTTATLKLIQALTNRIQREEARLYPLLK